MITLPGSGRHFNDNVLTFVIGVCGICYERDVRILVRCIFCFAIAGFRSARFYKCDVTNNCCGFGILVPRSSREFFQRDERIDGAWRLGAVLKRVERIFPTSTVCVTVYPARSAMRRRGEEQ